MLYTLNIMTYSAIDGLQSLEQQVATRDIKQLVLPDTTVSFNFPIPDDKPTTVYYIGQPLAKDDYLRRVLTDQPTQQDVISAERQIAELYAGNAYTALAVTSADDRIVRLKPDDYVLNNVNDRKIVWHNTKTPPRAPRQA